MPQDPVVPQAIANVSRRYAAKEWAMLSPRQITAEIYAEIRRLDQQRLEDSKALRQPTSKVA